MAAGVTMVHIDLAKADVFPDLTPIPQRLWKSFDIEVFGTTAPDDDWMCSLDLVRHGVWEPVETAVLSSAFAAAPPDTTFVDIGVHVGWYAILARQWDLKVDAWDGEERCTQLLNRRLDAGLRANHCWIADGWHYPADPWSPLIVKMDIEGHEWDAVQGMGRHFHAHTIQQAMIEITPAFEQFAATYPKLIDCLTNLDYECWVLPAKQIPPPPMGDTRQWLIHNCMPLHRMRQPLRDRWIGDQHQFNAIFCLESARWG